MKRRQFIGALGTVGAAAVAGCVGDDGDETDDPGNNADNDPSNTDNGTKSGTDGETGSGANGETSSTSGEQSTSESKDDESRPPGPNGSPTETVEGFLAAVAEDDVETALDFLHQDHPFHNMNSEETVNDDFGGAEYENLETEVVNENATLEAVFSSIEGAEFFLREEIVSDVLDDSESVIVEATATVGEGQSTSFRSVVVASDDEWQILWQGRPAEPAPEFDVVVVDEVVFDTETDQARVEFVESPVAETVTVESTIAGTSTEALETTDSLTVDLDPSGDEVVVTATADGESATVYRAQYPEQVVEEVIFDDDSDDAFGQRARVTFADLESEGELTVTSTRGGGEARFEPANLVDYLTLGVESSGDEIIVTLTEDGETAELYRKRFHPEE